MVKRRKAKRRNKSIFVTFLFLISVCAGIFTARWAYNSKYVKDGLTASTENQTSNQEESLPESENYTQKKTDTDVNSDNEESEETLPVEKKIYTGTKEEKVTQIINEMSLEEKVYQMMFVTPESITGVGQVVRAGNSTQKALKKYPIGGIVYFAQNFEDREQTSEMIKNTQNYSKIPLFISVDEEGGRVARLGQNSNMGTTKLPAMRKIGDTKNPQKAYEVGETLANDLKSLGFNVDFAPDADVIINENNSEIGDRSFGTDPENVSLMVENVVKGMEENGLSATLKHFPGHGSTYLNSHSGRSESERTLKQIKQSELKPFISGIDAGADFIMVSHMALVNATEEKVPSSVSKEIVTDLLINELGYKGIIITDSFSMGAITNEYSNGKAAVKAVNAGVDMILMPASLENAHSAIVTAVKNGDISEERIEKSVRKILMLKVNKGMI